MLLSEQPNRSRPLYFIYVVVTVFLGLTTRTNFPSMPNFISDYAGDTLWAMMLFWLAGYLFNKKEAWKIALYVAIFSFLIEFSQLYHAPWLDGIRQMKLGGLMLGYTFLFSDLLCYMTGIIIAIIIDLQSSKINMSPNIMGLVIISLCLLGITSTGVDYVFAVPYFSPLYSPFFISTWDAVPFILLLVTVFISRSYSYRAFHLALTITTFLWTMLHYLGNYTLDDPYILVDDRWGQVIYPIIWSIILVALFITYWLVTFFINLYAKRKAKYKTKNRIDCL